MVATHSVEFVSGGEQPSTWHAPLEDLETRGFVLIRGFLSEAELEPIRRDFENAPKLGIAIHSLRRASEALKAHLGKRLSEVADLIRERTPIDVDLITRGHLGGVYFTTDGSDKGFPWHLDHDTFYTYQNHTDYVNFYLVVTKPDPAKSNITLVPYDNLATKNPALASAVRGKGACHLLVKKSRTTFVYDEDDSRLGSVPFDISDIAETPELRAGDLLILRGDVFHRTQDAETRRVSISIRMINRHHRISRHRMVKGGIVKMVIMSKARADYERIFDYFDAQGTTSMTVEEFDRGVPLDQAPPPSTGGLGFAWRLFKERWKVRREPPFLIDAAAEKAR